MQWWLAVRIRYERSFRSRRVPVTVGTHCGVPETAGQMYLLKSTMGTISNTRRATVGSIPAFRLPGLKTLLAEEPHQAPCSCPAM